MDFVHPQYHQFKTANTMRLGVWGGPNFPRGCKRLLRRYFEPFLYSPKAVLRRYLDPLGSLGLANHHPQYHLGRPTPCAKDDSPRTARAAEVRQADVIFSTCVSARRNALLEALLQKSAPQIRQVVMDEAPWAVANQSFGACCLDVRTLTFCQLAGFFSIKPLKVKLLAGEQKATETRSGLVDSEFSEGKRSLTRTSL